MFACWQQIVHTSEMWNLFNLWIKVNILLNNIVSFQEIKHINKILETLVWIILYAVLPQFLCEFARIWELCLAVIQFAAGKNFFFLLSNFLSSVFYFFLFYQSHGRGALHSLHVCKVNIDCLVIFVYRSI